VSAFTAAELAYLRDVHPLARLATVGRDGTPHVMPIGMYRLDEALPGVSRGSLTRSTLHYATLVIP
jgi:hypothetical protein